MAKKKTKPAADKPKRPRKTNAKPRKLTDKEQREAKGQYEKHKEQVAARRERMTLAGQDIGPIPAIKDRARREACRSDLALFAKTYCRNNEKHLFSKPFSENHRKVIAKIEATVFQGGMYAVAMPRSSGKSTLCIAACCWALLYGWRRFVLLVGATGEHSLEMLDNAKRILEESPLLFEDFPEVAFPIRALDGEARKQLGQRCEGIRTEIHWGGDYVDLPRVPEGVFSQAAGGMLRCTSITGRLRGYNVGGVRPDLAIFDDPQSDESSESDSQNVKRERIIARSTIGLAEIGTTLAAIMPCTVIRPGDMVDRILSHELHPEWDSSRTKLLNSFPTDMNLWEKYNEIRIGYNPEIDRDKQRAATAATCHYIEHQAVMDAGAEITWAERYDAGDVSAVQYAMNLFFQDKYAFFSEYQNDPLPEERKNPDDLTSVQVAAKINGLPRGRIPIDASRLTAAIDVQGKLLYYIVCAWAEDFTGYVVDYGSWPDQQRPYFVLDDVQRTFETETGIVGQEAQIFAGLKCLTELILGKEWPREDGTGMRTERCNVDAGHFTDTIYQFCKSPPYSAILTPIHGKGIPASAQPITSRQKKPGERHGLNWVMPIGGKRAKAYVLADVNFWKSFVHARLAVPMGARGCLSLFGDTPARHRMLADHIVSETRNPVESERSGRRADEWHAPPHAENHGLDCLVYAAVAASMQGVSLDNVHQPTKPKQKRERLSIDEMKKRARETQGKK